MTAFEKILDDDSMLSSGIFLRAEDDFMFYVFITNDFFYGIFHDGLILRRSRKIGTIDQYAVNYLNQRKELEAPLERLLTSDHENLRNFVRFVSGLQPDKEIVIL